ncbi:hypothetical protein ACM46_08240 [Chryseobacterium angstadtii]|uniref:Uncharacterized protein n=2 Tax=Chryseobacterium angstadtii TaxID=558151 RepID=A0A0J7ICT5_9FLAO|nr:hypothetical protein ACM46_08240 [Chryseobacterium angstadtii]
MYLKTKNIYLLDSFIGGYLSCQQIHDKNFDDINFQSDFHEWLRVKFNFERGSTWADYIFKISQNEGLNSVDIFFREYYLFKEENL